MTGGCQLRDGDGTSHHGGPRVRYLPFAAIVVVSERIRLYYSRRAADESAVRAVRFDTTGCPRARERGVRHRLGQGLVGGAAVTVALAGAAVAQASARPTDRACAATWNRSASTSLRHAVAAAGARAAFVDSAVVVGLDWVQGGAATSTRSPGCGIAFVLRGRRILSVSGAWNHDRVPSWRGPVTSKRPVPVVENAAVRADGTVAFRG